MHVKVENVSKKFGSQVVLSNVNLDINSGEFLVLLGPSGCGKSTLLRLIAGLDQPNHGEIYLNGKPASGLPPYDRQLSLVFQNYALYPHMRVKENLTFALRKLNLTERQQQERLDWVSSLLKISDLLNRYPRELSGGQRQRVALGRALIRKPPLILFDEPLSNLDAYLRTQMRAEIKALHEQLGNTIIYVTHDQIEAMTLGQKVAIMNQGQIVQIDDPLQLYRKPKNIFVAEFVGTPGINLFDWSEIKDFLIHPIFSGLPKVLVGIRPENIRAYPKEGMEPFAKGKLVFWENYGSHFVYYVQVGRFVFRTLETPKGFLQSGQDITLYGWQQFLLFFDPITKQRIDINFGGN